MTFIHSPPIIPGMFFFNNDPAKDQRAWLEQLLDQSGLTATELARRADLNPSTLTRFLQPDGREGHTLSTRTVRKIEDAVGHLRTARKAPLGGLHEAEATPYDAAQDNISGLKAAITAIKAGRNGVDAWYIETDALEGLRLFRGDVVMVDLNAAPRGGDLVCAQIFNWQANRAETVFRLYEPPFLLSGSMQGDLRKPVAVDGQNVVVRGVVMVRLSPRDHVREQLHA